MRVVLRREEVTLAHPVRTAVQTHDRRSRLFLEIEIDGVAGFGEIAPQPYELNGDPSVHDVVDELVVVVLPRLMAVVERESGPPDWTRLAGWEGSRDASRFALALVEMALLDVTMQRSQRTVTDLWPPRHHVRSQATVSLMDDGVWSPTADASRLRVKTAPEALQPEHVDRLADLNLPIILDYNGGASTMEEVVTQVSLLSQRVTVDAVEQPFAVGNVIDHARLQERLSVAVSLDEGVRTSRDLVNARRYGAARMVCIKPARVGGLANARTLVQQALDAQMRVYLGGFFESPYARHVHAQLVAHCVAEPSDVRTVAVTSGTEETLEPRREGFGVRPSGSFLDSLEVIAVWESQKS